MNMTSPKNHYVQMKAKTFPYKFIIKLYVSVVGLHRSRFILWKTSIASSVFPFLFVNPSMYALYTVAPTQQHNIFISNLSSQVEHYEGAETILGVT